MTKGERHAFILRLLEDEGRIEVADLARRLGASEITTRRDVTELATRGYVERVHGAVLRSAGRSSERPFHVRESHAAGAKAAIAAEAVSLVSAGDAIALDVGSTVLGMVDLLGDVPDLTLVTANLRTAWAVASATTSRNHRLIVAGGVVRSGETSMYGAGAIAQLRRMRVDIAFLGVAGLSPTAGLTDFNLDDAEVKRVMIDTARRRVVLADHTKLDQQRFAHVADASEVDVVVTDDQADPETISALRASGVEVRVVAVRRPAPQGDVEPPA